MGARNGERERVQQRAAKGHISRTPRFLPTHTHRTPSHSPLRIMSEKIQEFLEVPQEFIHEGNQFLIRCTKPSRKEFVQICKAVAIGFAVMGFIGYLVKLIHIPINNILVGGA